MAMKLVALFVLSFIVSSDFVECKIHWFGRGRDHGHRRGHEFPAPQTEQIIEVAKDGSGNYRTITEALEAVQGKSDITINVQRGVYNEYLFIRKDTKNLRLNGDGAGATIISGNHGDSPSAGNYNLYDSATVAVEGDGFVAQGITFRNTAGIAGNQSAAIRVKADQVAFFRCSFEGYQDTVYAHSGRHLFKNCNIYGNTDFICGSAAAVFQNCHLILRRPKTPNGTITIAASSREDPNADEGFVFHNCRITSNGDIGDAKIYLGRPWKKYARTAFIGTSIEVPLQPEGWRHWQGGKTVDDREEERDVVYREYNNRGEGANTEGRVKWPGFKVITDDQEAEQFTVGNLLQGNNWVPRTGVPFLARI